MAAPCSGLAEPLSRGTWAAADALLLSTVRALAYCALVSRLPLGAGGGGASGGGGATGRSAVPGPDACAPPPSSPSSPQPASSATDAHTIVAAFIEPGAPEGPRGRGRSP